MTARPIALWTLLALLAAAPAALASGSTVINDCTDDEVLSRTYTQQEYRDALAHLPADADQYGNCRDIIARAQEAAATKGGKGGARKQQDSGQASTAQAPKASDRPASEQLAAATPADRAAAEQAASDAAVPDSTVAAGDVAVKPAAASSDLPAPVLVLLALLLAAGLALAAVRIRRLVHARRA